MNIRTDKKHLKRIFTKAAKIGFGSGLAIVIAHFLGLKYEIFAGTITLLTILTTKLETIRLSIYRVATFFYTVLVCYLIMNFFGSGWLEYGLFMFAMVLFCEFMGWGATISVNAVIGAHFFSESDMSPGFIANEFQLLLIGMVIAVGLSFISSNYIRKREVVRHMEYVEGHMKEILDHLASYLRKEPAAEGQHVWHDINQFEHQLKNFIQDACEYNNNSFSDHPEYYVDYFEMRLMQIDVLHLLHAEMRRMRAMPEQAAVVAEVIDYIGECIGKMNALDLQFEKLEATLAHFKTQPLPVTRDEFENRAVLYHVLMDIDDFLLIKKNFVDELDEKHINETFIK